MLTFLYIDAMLEWNEDERDLWDLSHSKSVVIWHLDAGKQ